LEALEPIVDWRLNKGIEKKKSAGKKSQKSQTSKSPAEAMVADYMFRLTGGRQAPWW